MYIQAYLHVGNLLRCTYRYFHLHIASYQTPYNRVLKQSHKPNLSDKWTSTRRYQQLILTMVNSFLEINQQLSVKLWRVISARGCPSFRKSRTTLYCIQTLLSFSWPWLSVASHSLPSLLFIDHRPWTLVGSCPHFFHTQLEAVNFD